MNRKHMKSAAATAAALILAVLAAAGNVNAQGGPSNNSPVSSTQNVNVVNAPTVYSNQSGAWNVGITGTPSVNVANTPTVGLASGASVLVGNGSSSPVWIRDVDGARQPVNATHDVNISGGSISGGGILYTVPAGKRLVIEYASLYCPLPPGQAAVFFVTTTVNGVSVQHYLTISPPSPGPLSLTAIGGPVHLYADPSTNVVLNIWRTDGSVGAPTCTGSISGYLTNVP